MLSVLFRLLLFFFFFFSLFFLFNFNQFFFTSNTSFIIYLSIDLYCMRFQWYAIIIILLFISFNKLRFKYLILFNFNRITTTRYTMNDHTFAATHILIYYYYYNNIFENMCVIVSVLHNLVALLVYCMLDKIIENTILRQDAIL